MHLVEKENSKLDGRLTPQLARQTTGRGLLLRLMEGAVTHFGGTWVGGNHQAMRRLEVLETLSIGPKKQIMLIRCESEKYLVATGPDAVQTIMRVESRTRPMESRIVVPELGERS